MRSKYLLLNLIILLSFLAKSTYANIPPDNLKKYTIKFNGKVTCKKPEEDIVGMFGAKVKLYVLREVSLNSKQPLVIDNLTGIGLDPKKLVADVAADGSFSIDVEFSSNLQLVKELFLEVYPGGNHGYVVSDEKQFITKTSQGGIYVYDKVVEGEPFRGVKFNFDYNKTNYDYNNLGIEVNPKMGVTCRYLKISHDFATWLANDIQLWDKVNIPYISVQITNNFIENAPSNAIALFIPQKSHKPKITIKPKYAAYGFVISHEFGHYFHYLINSTHAEKKEKDVDDNEKIAKEGFAEFYNMLVENYTANIYKDRLPATFSEKLPYLDTPYSQSLYSYHFNANIPRFATYLFNLYDGPTQVFMHKRHQGMDNDDIDGRKEGTYKKIFHIIKNMGKNEMYRSDFHAKMKAEVSPEVASSVEKNFDFIFNDNKDGIPSAQVKNAVLTIAYGGQRYNFNLQTFAYTDPKIFYYKNPPLGYMLYGKQKNSNWILIKTLPEKTESLKHYELIPEEIKGYVDFKVTAYNNSGESIHPLVFKNITLPVTIEGNTKVFADELSHWQAKIVGGAKPFTYTWLMKKVDSEEFFPGGVAGPSSSFTSKAPQGKSFVLQLFVTDKTGASGYKEMTVTTIIKPLKVTISGVSSITANEPTKWTATVEGGLPPYSYAWSKKAAGNITDIFIGQNNSCNIKSDKDFTLKLVVQDSKQSNAFSTKAISINGLAPLTSLISGDKLVYLHKEGQWQTEIVGGQPPYEVSWLKKKEGKNYSLAPFGQGLQCNNTVQEEGIFYIKTVVKDKNGKFIESPEFKVTAIYQPMYVVIENDNVVLNQGDKITWNGTVAGGKPGYKYQWKVGKSLNALTIISESVSNSPTTACPYQTKFNDVGKYFIVLTITDGLNKSVTVSKEFTVKEKPIVINNAVPGEELNNKQNVFTYYPNPVKDNFMLSYKVAEDAMVEVSLIDNRSRIETKILQQQYSKGIYQKSFNTGTLQSGVYTIRIVQKSRTGKITIAADKIIVVR